jgi:hypothetical protein
MISADPFIRSHDISTRLSKEHGLRRSPASVRRDALRCGLTMKKPSFVMAKDGLAEKRDEYAKNTRNICEPKDPRSPAQRH